MGVSFKLDDGTATKNNQFYGVSVMHHEEIIKVNIKYKHLEISFNEIVYYN